MTDYLITHDSLAGGLMMVSFLLLMVSVYGLVLFYRFSAALVLLLARGVRLGLQFAIPSSSEYRRLASMMPTAPQPDYDDGVVSRVNSKTFRRQFDHALMSSVK